MTYDSVQIRGLSARIATRENIDALEYDDRSVDRRIRIAFKHGKPTAWFGGSSFDQVLIAARSLGWPTRKWEKAGSP